MDILQGWIWDIETAQKGNKLFLLCLFFGDFALACPDCHTRAKKVIPYYFTSSLLDTAVDVLLLTIESMVTA